MPALVGNHPTGGDETTAHGRISHCRLRPLRPLHLEPDLLEVARAQAHRAGVSQQPQLPVRAVSGLMLVLSCLGVGSARHGLPVCAVLSGLVLVLSCLGVGSARHGLAWLLACGGRIGGLEDGCEVAEGVELKG